jgi:hypothetical protein
MLIEIDGSGRITRIDEYYNKKWDEGVSEQLYTVLKGESMGSKV